MLQPLLAGERDLARPRCRLGHVRRALPHLGHHLLVVGKPAVRPCSRALVSPSLSLFSLRPVMLPPLSSLTPSSPPLVQPPLSAPPQAPPIDGAPPPPSASPRRWTLPVAASPSPPSVSTPILSPLPLHRISVRAATPVVVVGDQTPPLLGRRCESFASRRVLPCACRAPSIAADLAVHVTHVPSAVPRGALAPVACSRVVAVWRVRSCSVDRSARSSRPKVGAACWRQPPIPLGDVMNGYNCAINSVNNSRNSLNVSKLSKIHI